MQEPNIIVYGAPWCPDCRRSKQFLGEQRVPYKWVDIDQDERGRQRVQEINDGKQIIPTILFEDGSVLVEPTDAELAASSASARRRSAASTTSSWWVAVRQGSPRRSTRRVRASKR